MWSKRSLESEGKNTTRTFETHHIAQTSQTLSVRTTEYRTRSVSYTSNGTEIRSLASLPKLGNCVGGNNFSLSPKYVPKSSSVANLGNRVMVDAKPIRPPDKNLNYESPYRNSPVFNSFHASKPVTKIASFSKPSPSIVVSKTPSPTIISTARIVVKKTDDNNFSSSPKPVSKSSSVANLGNRVIVDAKPIRAPPKNLNYQSPYRPSPVFNSFHAPKPVTNIASYSKPSPAIVVSKTPTPTFNTSGIIVKKTGKFYDGNCAIPTYQTHGKNRGEVLIINNIMFSDKGYRHGAQVDDKKLKDVFEQIGFSVTVRKDLKTNDMISKIKDFSKKNSLKMSDIAIIIVMSHGTKNATLGGTEIFGIDEIGIPTEELLQPFIESNCKSMIGKPKIFIFQCCRGDNEQFVQSDATRSSSASCPALKDSLIAYSSLPGFRSYRDLEHGTWYISALCDVFSQHAHEYPVEDLLKMVDMKLSNWQKNVRQTTHYENRSFKRCFLHPK